MRSKVIIFCVLLFCSKFVASIPFVDESIQQRAYQPNNWQGNQNIADHYHGNGFAQAQNLNSMISPEHRNEHSHEHVNQGKQNFDHYAFNNNPLLQQSLPIKDTQANFAPESNERKLDSFPERGDPFPISTNNYPIRGDTQQYRPNNWQPQNHFVNFASSASAAAVSGPERPVLPVREPYRNPNDRIHYSPPALNHQHNQPERVNPVGRDVHYHPVEERPTNVRYMQHTGPDSDASNRHVHYENYNQAHATPINTNGAQSGNNGLMENSTPPHPQPYEGYNGSPAMIPDTTKNVGNYQMRYGPRNPNIPNTYNIGRPVPSNTVVNNGNNRHMRQPVINASPNNHLPPKTYEAPIIPRNTASDNTGNNRYLEKGHKARSPINNYRYVHNPVFNKNNNGGPNIYNAPILPTDVVFDKTVNNKYNTNPMVDSGSNYQSPVNAYNEAIPALIDSILSGSGQNTPTKPVPVDNNDESNKDKQAVQAQTLPSLGSSNPSPPEDVNKNRNTQNYHSSGSDRGNAGNIFKTQFRIVFQNGTVQEVDEDQVKQAPGYILKKKHDKPVDGTDYKSPLSSLPPKNTPAVYDGPRSPGSQSPASNKSNLSPVPQLPTDDKYGPSPGPQSPSNNDNNSPLEKLYPDGHKYQPHNPTQQQPQDNNYPHSPSKIHRPSFTTTTKAPDDKMLQDFLGLFSNKADKNSPSDVLTSGLNSNSDENSKDKNTPVNQNNDNNYYPSTQISKLHTHISPGIFKSTTSRPSEDIDDGKQNKNDNNSSEESLFPNENDYLIYNSSRNNDHTTPSPKLHTVISPGIIRSTTTADDLIKSHDDEPHDSDSNTRSSSVTNGPETTTEDGIITISPIELMPYNRNDGSTSSEIVAPGYNDDGAIKSSIPPPNDSDTVDEVQTDNNTNTDTKNKNTSGSATNDYLANTDVPATPDDNSAVATNYIKQSDVNTGDNSTNGDNLLESKSNTSDISITLNISNDSDGTITIKLEVPESTGIGDSSGDDTLVVNINTKNCSDADFVTAKSGSKDSNNYQTNSDETDINKNFVIDLANSAILLNNATNKDIFDQIANNSTVLLFYLIKMELPPIIERNTVTTIFANNTVTEEMTETTWQSKNDTTPTVVNWKKTYQQGAKD